jgi:hypothetical protein
LQSFFKLFLPIKPTEAFAATFAFKGSSPLLQCKVIRSKAFFAAIVTLAAFWFFVVISTHFLSF